MIANETYLNVNGITFFSEHENDDFVKLCLNSFRSN